MNARKNKKNSIMAGIKKMTKTEQSNRTFQKEEMR
jgi:hypothetical protein